MGRCSLSAALITIIFVVVVVGQHRLGLGCASTTAAPPRPHLEVPSLVPSLTCVLCAFLIAAFCSLNTFRSIELNMSCVWPVPSHFPLGRSVEGVHASSLFCTLRPYITSTSHSMSSSVVSSSYSIHSDRGNVCVRVRVSVRMCACVGVEERV